MLQSPQLTGQGKAIKIIRDSMGQTGWSKMLSATTTVPSKRTTDRVMIEGTTTIAGTETTKTTEITTETTIKEAESKTPC